MSGSDIDGEEDIFDRLDKSSAARRWRMSHASAALPSSESGLCPKDISELELMRDEALMKQGKITSLDVDATDKAIQKVWGTSGAWHVCSDMPANSETPMTERGFRLLPKSREPAADVLARHGLSAICVKGCKSKGDCTVGQDTFCTARLAGGWRFHCVADGHGGRGDWVANRVTRVLPFFLTSLECRRFLRHDNVEAALHTAFERMQQDIVAHASSDDVDLFCSGTTCACILREIHTSDIWVATLGDARIVLVNKDGTVVRTTTDHKPSVPEERDRVMRSGCEITAQEMDTGEVIERVCIEGRRYPAVSFTRSFGDACVKDRGVTAQPCIERWAVRSAKGGYLFAATDGVWEYLENEEVGRLIHDALQGGASRQDALRRVVKEAQQRWAEHAGNYCDDICAVLVPVDQKTTKPPVPDDRCLACPLPEVCSKRLERCCIQ